ncbi:MAG: MBL fold metallo-hydrolase [Saprospiraceae bacterium]|nr:MBL fold metallo-hydrolase [Saprospiraceae bacterium]
MANILFRDPNVTVLQSALFRMNTTVVHTDDVVMVFDPGILPEEIRAIQQLVEEKRGDKPLYLLFTHSDFDHILGFRAFSPNRVFMTEAMANHPRKEELLEEALTFDEQYYLQRNYQVEYPVGNFLVYQDGVQFRVGQTKMSIYLMPGHTIDSMMVIIWQLGLLIAGDYLSDLEFPIITDSSMAYEATLLKLNTIHDKNWFTRVVPGHGSMVFDMDGWMNRQQQGLAYLYALRESISTGVPFDEDSLWSRYPNQRGLQHYHHDNMALMRREYEQGLWTWNPELLNIGRHEPEEQGRESISDE